MLALFHLATDGVSLVVDARGPEFPSILHWGAPLGAAGQDDLAAIEGAVARPVPTNSYDVPPPMNLLSGASQIGRPGLSGHRHGRDWAPEFRLTGADQQSGPDGVQAITLTSADDQARLSLTSEIELFPAGLLRVRHMVRNAGAEPYTMDGLNVTLPVPPDAAELLDFTGRHLRERSPQRHAFRYGTWLRESRRGRTGLDATIGMLAGTAGFDGTHGEVWGVHVAWSGNHLTFAERLVEGHAVLGGGELLLPGEVVLGPDEEYASPWVYAVYSARGLDGVQQAFHRWFRARAEHPVTARPVVLNTWEAVYFDHDLDRLKGLADVAARVGVERFVLDDGWFRRRRDATAGLGDWSVDERVWPEGLHPLIDHVRGLGMEFGLWVEPEMINEDSDLFRGHPDWVIRARDGELPPAFRHQQVLDLANPAAWEHVLSRLDALLSEYGIGYLKWDHNRDIIGHAHAQTRAFYGLVDELRRRHPAIEIESCSSGGGRVDLEVLRRTDRIWVSDCNDALERQAIQRWTSLFIPLELQGTHVGAPRSHTTGRTQDLAFRVATALFGHFGIEWDLASASDDDLVRLARSVAYYKEVRPLLHDGDLIEVPYPESEVQVRGVVAADRASALFSFAQLATSPSVRPARLRLPGLDPDRRYRIRVAEPAGPAVITRPSGAPPWYAAREIVLRGRVLGAVGLQLPRPAPEQAVLLRLDAES